MCGLGQQSAVLTELLQAADDVDYRARRLWKLAQWARLEENRGPKAHRRVVVAERAFVSYVLRLDEVRATLEAELQNTSC